MDLDNKQKVIKIRKIKETLMTNDYQFLEIFYKYVEMKDLESSKEINFESLKKVIAEISIKFSYDIEGVIDLISSRHPYVSGYSYPIIKENLLDWLISQEKSLNNVVDIDRKKFVNDNNSNRLDTISKLKKDLTNKEELNNEYGKEFDFTDETDINVIILHRSLYLLKRKFEDHEIKIKEVYKHYSIKNEKVNIIEMTNFFLVVESVMKVAEFSFTEITRPSELLKLEVLEKLNQDKVILILKELKKYYEKNCEKYNELLKKRMNDLNVKNDKSEKERSLDKSLNDNSNIIKDEDKEKGKEKEKEKDSANKNIKDDKSSKNNSKKDKVKENNSLKKDESIKKDESAIKEKTDDKSKNKIDKSNSKDVSANNKSVENKEKDNKNLKNQSEKDKLSKKEENKDTSNKAKSKNDTKEKENLEEKNKNENVIDEKENLNLSENRINNTLIIGPTDNEKNIEEQVKSDTIFIEILPVLIADFLQDYPGIVLVDKSNELRNEIKALFDNEILHKLGDLAKNDLQEEKINKTKELLFEKMNVERNLDLYEDLLIKNKAVGRNTIFIEGMLQKLKMQKMYLEKKIKEFQEDEVEDVKENYNRISRDRIEENKRKASHENSRERLMDRERSPIRMEPCKFQ